MRRSKKGRKTPADFTLGWDVGGNRLFPIAKRGGQGYNKLVNGSGSREVEPAEAGKVTWGSSR